MLRPPSLHIALIAGALAVLVMVGAYSWYSHWYSHIFRLFRSEVVSSLISHPSSCGRISKCDLLPGDILIRRYITQRTELMDRVIHPFFTHSAFYLGEDTLVEAVGTEANKADEVRVSRLSTSDWMDDAIDSFVIIRPRYTPQQFLVVADNLQKIAQDQNYRFGLPQMGDHYVSCADLIFSQLLAQRLVSRGEYTGIITPDYLYWVATRAPNFQIVGYSAKK